MHAPIAQRLAQLGPLITGIAYLAGAWIGVRGTIMPEGIVILWPPNAFLLTALLIERRARWPAHIVAAVVAELIADHGVFTLGQSLAFAAVNVFEAGLAALLIRRRLPWSFRFDRLRSVLAFALFGPIIACGMAGALGGTIYFLTADTANSFWTYWRIWWFGDATGLLVVTPLAWLLARYVSSVRRRPRRLLAKIVWGGLGAAATHVIFMLQTPALEQTPVTPLLILPLVLLAGVRHGVGAAAATGLAVAAVAVWHTTRGSGPYAHLPDIAAVLALQEFLTVTLCSALALAALLNDLARHRLHAEQESRRRAHAETLLREANRELEARVAARTEELARANAALQKQATTDALTGLCNRRSFLERAQEALHRARRSGLPFALIMWDLDHFKRFNDDYGHDVGDRVLTTAAACILRTVRATDTVARYGGEEFMVLAPDTDLEAATALAEKLRRALEQLEITVGSGPDARRLAVTASFGVAVLHASDQDPRTLIQRADEALYGAKRRGRNRVVASAAASPALPLF